MCIFVQVVALHDNAHCPAINMHMQTMIESLQTTTMCLYSAFQRVTHNIYVHNQKMCVCEQASIADHSHHDHTR